MQLAISHFRERTDGALAASTHAIQKSALAGGSSAGRSVVQECEELAHRGVFRTNFDSKRALSSRWAHDFGGDILSDQFCPAEALQASKCENDAVVFSLFEFAQ